MNEGFEWSTHGAHLIEATGQTLYMVSATLVIGGLLGLVLGLGLYTTRKGGLLQNRWIFAILNLVVNIFRPIPFLILLFAVAPLTVGIVGTRLGSTAMIVPMSVAATWRAARGQSASRGVVPGPVNRQRCTRQAARG